MEEKNRNTSEKQENTGAQQGNYKNIETAVNNPSYFDDDYEVEQENKITEHEHKTEDEGRVGKS